MRFSAREAVAVAVAVNLVASLIMRAAAFTFRAATVPMAETRRICLPFRE
ncbi:hypothetical protein [Lacimonas salitolerans]|uniref:Uncharacterized protein n=1 Tax=Lacimonas salitolerans TaxID=1323750 RepID=A0ABW4EIY2_9RHOB